METPTNSSSTAQAIMLAIIVFLAAALIVVLFVNRSDSPDATTEQPEATQPSGVSDKDTSEEDVSPATSDSEESDMQTYTSTTYGFSLEYPADYEYRERRTGESENLVAVFGPQVPAEDYPMAVYFYPTLAEARADGFTSTAAGQTSEGFIFISAPQDIRSSIVASLEIL